MINIFKFFNLCLLKGSRDKYSGKAADIWSMGITLYCFFYGKVILYKSMFKIILLVVIYLNKDILSLSSNFSQTLSWLKEKKTILKKLK